MGRSFQAKHAEALMKIADITTTSTSPRKCLRESEVIKSDKMVENIKDTLKNQFINPFHGDLEDDQLYNLVSGYPVDDGVKACLLSVEERGNDRMLEFKDRLCKCPANKDFFDPIKKEPLATFNSLSAKAKVKVNGRADISKGRFRYFSCTFQQA